MELGLTIRALLAAIAFCLFSSVPARAETLQVEIARSGNEWTATFNFPTAARSWAFLRSNLTRRGQDSWRLRSWTVLTEGVRLERQGRFDVLTAGKREIPRRVSIRFQPFAEDLMADYDPALVFSDGVVALFTGHFAAGRWDSLTAQPLGQAPEVRISLRDDAGPLLYKGVKSPSVTTKDLDAYVVFGAPRLLEDDNLAGIIDPQTPEWLRQEMVSFLPRSFALFRQRLGAPGGTGKPTIMVSWAGSTAGLRSQGGSVLPNLIAVRLEGERLLTPSDKGLQELRWFVGHESAHFWLGQAVTYGSPDEAWITEGGADLLSYRLIEAVDPAYRADLELKKDWGDCLFYAQGKPVSTAGSRNEHRAYYACGALFALIAEGAAKKNGQDFFDFIRKLIDANRTSNGGDGRVTSNEWLAALTAASGDATIARDMRAMLVDGVADPRASLTSLFQRVGLQPLE